MMPPGYIGHDRNEGITPGVPGDGPQGQQGQHHGDQGDDEDGKHETRSRGKAIEWIAYDAKAVDYEDDDDDDEETETILEGIDPNDPIKVSRFLKI